MCERPSGTVTFLFTDIEGSTRLWQDEPGAMGQALERHDLLLRSCIEDRGGYVFKTVGDSFCAAFESAISAVNAALALQLAIKEEEWSNDAVLQVRTALHSGEAVSRDGDYFGVELSRVGRLLSAAHGGQVLVSGATKELVQDHLPDDSALRPMGSHRLRDLSRTEDVFQLEHRELEGEFPALKTLDNLPNNLPQQLTSFIGREQELEELAELFNDARLLTLTGVGGTGKTRLALQFAADQLDSFKDGVWLVELAALSDTELVAKEVALALAIKEEPGKTMTETLAVRLAEKEALIVLDNCEHLLDGCYDLCEALLRSCKGLRILATSREGLGVKGEQAFSVRSFRSPDAETSVAGLMLYDSVSLFVDRARMARAGFEIDDNNARAIVTVCTRLDGIPLAIELAAARIRSMTPQDVSERLDQKFRLLTGGTKRGLRRQQTLQGLIDWSFDLLNESEKALLIRLSVFRGGWSANAAEKVCCDDVVDELAVIELLSSLVDKSLVLSEDVDGHSRYMMLETVRDYSAEKLLASDQQDVWRNRHLEFFMVLAEDAEERIKGKKQQTWLRRLEMEHDNVRTALDWSTSSPDRAEDGLRLVAAFWRFWQTRGHLTEGRARLDSALESPKNDSPARPWAVFGAGCLAYNQANYKAAVQLFEEALQMFLERGDKSGEASVLSGLGTIKNYKQDHASARAYYETALAIFRETGDKRQEAVVLGNLGVAASHAGDYANALARQEESLAIRREIGDKEGIASCLGNLGAEAFAMGHYDQARAYQYESLALTRELGTSITTAIALVNLGDVACELGDFAEARTRLSECLDISVEIGDQRVIAFALEHFVVVLDSEKRSTDSALVVGAAHALRARIGAPLPSSGQDNYDARVSASRATMGDDAAFDAAVEEGGKMTLEEAVALCLSEGDDE